MDYILPYLPEKIRNIPTHMDFDGQRRAERFFQIIISLFAVVGFVWGYITQLFSQTLYILFAGVVVSSLLTLIPWSIYRKEPLPWQPARDPDSMKPIQAGNTGSGGSGSQGKQKKKKVKD